MTVTVVVGAQWGDEGKGRIVDYLAARVNWVVRFQGGNNAGHTVVNDLGEFKLHLVPSGILTPGVRCLLGAGTVVDADGLLSELDELGERGVDAAGLVIDRRAHLVLPYHRMLDGAREGGAALGTTKRGIGPCYGDKAAYRGIRMGDLLEPEHLAQRLRDVLPLKNHELAFYGLPPLGFESLLKQCADWRARLGERIVDGAALLRRAVGSGENVLLEGQLGVMRDLDWGIYPYTTASSPSAGGACAGAGIPPGKIDRVVGVVKAYSTSVGGGPFPTELQDEDGAKLREVGREYGASTGRPRRCGWYDAVAVRYAARVNGLDAVALTKMDVLDGLPHIDVCTAYRCGDRTLTEFPGDLRHLAACRPVYERLPGWSRPTHGVRTYDELPPEAKAYIARLEELTGVPAAIISTGSDRDETIFRGDSVAAEWFGPKP